MTTSVSANAEWLERAAVLAGRTLTGYRLPPEVDFVVDHGRGARVWDLDGRSYVDHLLGSGPLILGHAHPAVVDAVVAQVGRGSTYYALNQPAIELAEKIVEASPCAERVRFFSTGSEATAYAMRLARAATGRSKVLKFEGGYHGSHDAALISFAPSVPGTSPDGVPDSAGITQGVRQDILVAPYNDGERTAAIVHGHAASLAAIIVEPQQRCIPPAPGFLASLRDLASEVGALLIFDEVVTGFRLAYGGAQEFYQVVPDLAAYGKIIGGGYPLSAVAGPAAVLDLADPDRKGRPEYVYLSGTLNGNPVAAVAGLATLAELRQPGAYQRLHAAGARLRAGLSRAAEQAGVPVTVIGQGPLAAVHFTERPVRTYADVLSADRALLTRTNTGLLRRGVLAQLATKFYVSLVHTDVDLDATGAAFGEALAEAAGRG